MLKIITAAALLALSVSFAAPASAVGVGKGCGGLPNIACDAGLFCEKRAGQCNVADSMGRCARIPEACTLKKGKIYLPVCGCDGKTYGNDCQRQAAAVSKNHNGACK